MKLREISPKNFAQILFCLLVIIFAATTPQAAIFAATNGFGAAACGTGGCAVIENPNARADYELRSSKARSAVVGGRVVTAEGRGVAFATVTLMNLNGKRRSVHTDSFGYYCFQKVAAGEDYIIYVESKRYIFEPRFVPVEAEMLDVNFIAEP